jgi:hypothetical protein
MKLDSTRLEAQTLFPNVRPLWRNQSVSKISAATPERKKIPQTVHTTGIRVRLLLAAPEAPEGRGRPALPRARRAGLRAIGSLGPAGALGPLGEPSATPFPFRHRFCYSATSRQPAARPGSIQLEPACGRTRPPERLLLDRDRRDRRTPEPRGPRRDRASRGGGPVPPRAGGGAGASSAGPEGLDGQLDRPGRGGGRDAPEGRGAAAGAGCAHGVGGDGQPRARVLRAHQAAPQPDSRSWRPPPDRRRAHLIPSAPRTPAP